MKAAQARTSVENAKDVQVRGFLVLMSSICPKPEPTGCVTSGLYYKSFMIVIYDHNA